MCGENTNDHSVHGYLRRQSDEQLEIMLHYCLNQGRSQNYIESIRAIMDVMKERQKSNG